MPLGAARLEGLSEETLLKDWSASLEPLLPSTLNLKR